MGTDPFVSHGVCRYEQDLTLHKNNKFPEHTCCCLCRVKWQGEYKHVTLHYYDKDDWCCECSGDLVDPNCVEAWADINDILEHAYP
jgi:hypothetical protein